jgi:hypothetical protein
VVGSRADGSDHLFGLRRREDELDVLRRLFDDLQQRVEPLWRHHVRLVEDEDLVAVPCRGEHGALPQVACVVDTVVARCIDLHDIHRSTAVAAQLDAARADAARSVGGAFHTVEAPGQYPGGGRLATAARSAEEIGVVDPVVSQRRAQRIGHLRLPDQLGESLWPITAIQGGDHQPRLPGADDTTRAVRPQRRPVFAASEVPSIPPA